MLLSAVTVFFLLFAISAKPVTLAVPGQLIYDVNTPAIDNSLCNETIANCKKETEATYSLYNTCVSQKAQTEKINTLLGLLLGAVILALLLITGIALFVLRKRPAPQQTTS